LTDQNLEISQAGQSTDITCRSLRGLEALFQDKPELIIQGDTTTAFAAAMYLSKIPVGHAGNRIY